mmetsp:Transcript_14753/g.10652  ORF Transcript_14753/g.10652 Transcript_14753/m.10652 type:complete len:196 (+) Transcript_14753:730-1317(+)
MFFCRNNMYAISTPIDDQYAGDGIAVRGVAYGMPTIRVDGNDLFAIYNAVKTAREIIMKEKRPALVEAITYRTGHHSTSDDSTAYRNEEEMKKWDEHLRAFSDPISRLEKYLLKKGLVKKEEQQQYREKAKAAVRVALKNGIAAKKAPIDDLFNEVYAELPKSLQDQKEELRAHLRKFKQEYPLDEFKHSDKFIN